MHLRSMLSPVFQILEPKSHMVTELSVQWSVFITYWNENAVPKYSAGNVCNLFQEEFQGENQGQVTFSKKKHSTICSHPTDPTPGATKLLCLLVFSILADLFQEWLWY